MPTESDTLAELIADARQLPAPMLPRPRTWEQRVAEDPAPEIRIPDETVSLLDGYAPYGA
jgi:hypothetical protein